MHRSPPPLKATADGVRSDRPPPRGTRFARRSSRSASFFCSASSDTARVCSRGTTVRRGSLPPASSRRRAPRSPRPCPSRSECTSRGPTRASSRRASSRPCMRRASSLPSRGCRRGKAGARWTPRRTPNRRGTTGSCTRRWRMPSRSASAPGSAPGRRRCRCSPCWRFPPACARATACLTCARRPGTRPCSFWSASRRQAVPRPAWSSRTTGTRGASTRSSRRWPGTAAPRTRRRAWW